MASVLHGSARTTACLRAEFQASKESTRSLAARYGLNPKTVGKWRKRTTTADAPMGSRSPKSTVLRSAEEAIVVTFRQKTLLRRDDVIGCHRLHPNQQNRYADRLLISTKSKKSTSKKLCSAIAYIGDKTLFWDFQQSMPSGKPCVLRLSPRV